MYSLLIVDDEKSERDGIKFLVNMFKFNLKIYEAENGKKALEIIKSNRLDILCTDIKMPFMDGLDLIAHAKGINLKIKAIIFSAYGEFDYAKRAIDSSVQNYILKPIDPDEFFTVMSHLIQMCREEEEESKREKRLLEGFTKGLEYEKERILSDLINGTKIDGNFLKRLQKANLDFENQRTVAVLITVKDRFFDQRNDDFVDFLKLIFKVNFEYLNLNEFQTIVFFYHLSSYDQKNLKIMGDQILQKFLISADTKVCLIISSMIDKIEGFFSEFKKMEQLLDYCFLFDENVILFVDKDFPGTVVSTKILDKIMNDIVVSAMSDDTEYAASSMEQLFKSFKMNKSVSSIFIKYNCAEIIKRIQQGNAKNNLRELLLNTNMRVNDICEKVGYTKTSYFCGLFKNTFGVTPAKYREIGK